jgi:hypothetical protein
MAKARTGECLELVTSLRDYWLGLDAPARTRAAGCPFLLVDLHFQNESWWRSNRQSRKLRFQRLPRDHCLPARPAASLMRETLVLAWHATRLDRRASSLLVGASPAVAELIAAMRLPDIERLAASQHAQLRPRWEDRGYFWRQLLVAARSGDDEALHELRLHGLQLAGGELLSCQARPHAHSSSRGDA